MSAARAAIARAFTAAVLGFDLSGAVRVALDGELGLGRVRVFAVGKAAAAMLEGARAALGARIERALLVVPDGLAAPAATADLDVLRAAHPLPDARSVAAAEAAFAFVLGAREEEAIVALISGGTSSLLCAPIDGLTLDDKRVRVDALLRSGADIRAINAARRALSRIKGGGLARAAAPRAVLTLVASDVLDGQPEDVGSGPTVPGRHDLAAIRCRARIVAGPDAFAERVARELSAQGFAVRVLLPSGADVHALAAEYIALAPTLAARAAVVRAAEPTVVVPAGAGAGGRSCHLAALVARALPDDVAFLAGASDGVDGGSLTAGACVERGSFATRGAAVDESLARFASGDLHRAAGTALPAGPTGRNFADVHVLARE